MNQPPSAEPIPLHGCQVDGPDNLSVSFLKQCLQEIAVSLFIFNIITSDVYPYVWKAAIIVSVNMAANFISKTNRPPRLFSIENKIFESMLSDYIINVRK